LTNAPIEENWLSVLIERMIVSIDGVAVNVSVIVLLFNSVLMLMALITGETGGDSSTPKVMPKDMATVGVQSLKILLNFMCLT
jgi:hypothetical protein